MCVKLTFGDLNPDPCPPHPTSTYTCEVTIGLRVCGGDYVVTLKYILDPIVAKNNPKHT